jgi:hypothetical protein
VKKQDGGNKVIIVAKKHSDQLKEIFRLCDK